AAAGTAAVPAAARSVTAAVPTSAAATAAIAAATGAAAITPLPGHRRLLGGLAALLAEHRLARQPHAAPAAGLDDLHQALLPLVEHVANLVDPVLLDLRDVQQPLDAGEDLDEGAERDHADDLPEISLAELRLGGELFDDRHRFLRRRLVRGGDVDA